MQRLMTGARGRTVASEKRSCNEMIVRLAAGYEKFVLARPGAGLLDVKQAARP